MDFNFFPESKRKYQNHDIEANTSRGGRNVPLFFVSGYIYLEVKKKYQNGKVTQDVIEWEVDEYLRNIAQDIEAFGLIEFTKSPYSTQKDFKYTFEASVKELKQIPLLLNIIMYNTEDVDTFKFDIDKIDWGSEVDPLIKTKYTLAQDEHGDHEFHMVENEPKPKRGVSSYNEFMKQNLPLYFKQYPFASQKEAFNALGVVWKTSPMNPNYQS